MRELIEIRQRLMDLAECEAAKLYRLARKAQEHNCDKSTVCLIREEATWLHTTAQAYPDRVIQFVFDYKFKFAFKLEGECKFYGI